jgi:hypothetical protein
MPTLPTVVFDVVRAFCPPVLQLVFVRSGRMPTLPSVVFDVVRAFCPPVLQLVFIRSGRDAHTTVGGF